MNFLFIFFVIFNISKIMPSLKEILKNAGSDEKTGVLVHLKEKPDYERIKDLNPKDYVEFLKIFSEKSQKDIINYLKSNFSNKISDLNPYWIFNGFYLKATKDVIEKISEREDVEYIIEDFVIKIEKPEISYDIRTPEWNIKKVKADSCWMQGYTGQGVIIGHMDTGVDIAHPALQGKFEGHWYDPVNGQPSPYDDQGHGTHVMGIILGGDGLGPFQDDIGVAPGAKFVACKICDLNGSCQTSWIHSSFQKIAEWKSQGVDIKVVNNSWGSYNTTSLEFWDDCLNWRNLGIVPVFAIGGSGPNPGTAATPGNFPIVIGVGATDSNDNIASFSSRGPAPNQSPWNNPEYWPRPDWNLTKPDISAPGVNIRSSVPGGGYASYSGTSMATPHLTGATAILLSKNPYLNFYEIYELLTDYAFHPPQGQPYPNNNYGWGRLDVYKALLNTPPEGINIHILNHIFEDENNNYIWEPGENGNLKVTLKNSGLPAQNVIGMLRTNSPYVTIIDSVSYFGDISTGDSSNNFSDPYILHADSFTPPGTPADLILHITADTNYVSEDTIKKYIGIPLFDWIDHDCGNILLTLTRYGAIGYMGSDQLEGNGCQYPMGSPTRLHYGSFAIGTDYPYVIDRYYEENFVDDDDWVTLSNPDGRIRILEPYPPFSEYSLAIYDDSGGEEVKGIMCKQKGYAWNDFYAKDFVILEYTLKNNSSQEIQGIFAGIFLDLDVEVANYNQGNVELQRNIAYLYHPASSLHMGCAILNPPRGSQEIANLSMIDHDLYVFPYGGLPDSIEIKFLNGTITQYSTNRTYDWSICVSAGPFNLQSQDSVKVAFAIAGGASLYELREHIDTAYARYWNLIKVEEKKMQFSTGNFRLKNILKNKKLILYNLSLSESKICVYDLSGRLMRLNVTQNKKDATINLENLPGGIYFLKINQKDKVFKNKFIIIK